MIALAITLAAALAAGSAPEATARADVEAVALGDRFHVFVDVLHRVDVKVNLPGTVPLGDAFSVEGRETSATDHRDGTVTTRFDLTVAAYDVGELEVPPIEVTYVADGTARAVSTAAVAVRVDSVVGDADDALRPLAGPVQVTRPDWTPAYVLGGLCGVVALAALAWAVRGRRRRRAVVQLVAQTRRAPPAEEALARLVALEASGALEAESLGSAYTALSEIMRDYLGRRYGFPALDLTTGEINDDLRARPEAAEVAGELGEWFATCDAVKFAEYPSTPDEARAALYQARVIVQKSTPRAEATAGADDGEVTRA